MDQPVLPAAPTTTTPADPDAEPPVLTPCIAELLRTGYNPPHLLLRVERIIDVPVLHDHEHDRTTANDATDANDQREREPNASAPRHRTFRLFLSDSELLIQALLTRELHHFVALGEVVTGCVMRVEAFRLCWAERTKAPRKERSELRSQRDGVGDGAGVGGGRQEGRIAYLAVERFRTVWIPPHHGAERSRGVECGEPVVKKREIPDDGGIAGALSETKRLKKASECEVQGLEKKSLSPQDPGDNSSEGQSASAEAEHEETKSNNDGNTTAEHDDQKSPARTTSHPQDYAPLPAIPNLLTLSTLLNPPRPLPQRNYVVSLLAIVSSISPRTRTPPPHTRLPVKRDLRLVDSSLPFRSSGLHLSVFRDAENFAPPVGTLALFVGLKTHEWEGVSLNAFEVRGGVDDPAATAGAGEWFVDDRARLESAGFDVGMQEKWWADRCALLGG